MEAEIKHMTAAKMPKAINQSVVPLKLTLTLAVGARGKEMKEKNHINNC